MYKLFIVRVVVLMSFMSATAQLGNRHWLPPIHSRTAPDVEDHYVYLSTPAENDFEVTLRYGTTLIRRSISSGNPARVFIGDDKPSPMFTADEELNRPLSDKGILLSGSEEFYASFRVRSRAQAGYLTTKGNVALGTLFRLGSMPQTNEVEDKNFFASVMATEDNTIVTITDFDPQVVLEGQNPPTGGVINILLNAGQSYIVSGNTTSPANYEGFIGALVTSNNPIVVNTGNGLGGFQGNSRDYTIDQIVPVNQVGSEYVVVEGNGNQVTERPMIVATEPNTTVSVNGNVLTTLQNAGDFVLINNNLYQGNTGHRNMYIAASANVYVYQFLAGDIAEATVGMNFIPPLSCFFQREVDMIPEVDRIGEVSYSSDVIAVTRSGAMLTLNGNNVSATPLNLAGNTDWVTYRLFDVRGDVSIASTGPLSVGIMGYNGTAGFAGYYSGFGAVPKDSETVLCAAGITDLFEELEGNPERGGVWTNPNGLPHSGMFDPTTDPLGTYNYFLNSDCALIDVNLTINDLIVPLSAGENTALFVCKEEPSFELINVLIGNPDRGGIWRTPEGNEFNGIFDPAIFESGTYSYGFYNNDPCEDNEITIEITMSSAPDSVEAILLSPFIATGAATVEVIASGGLGDYEYQIDNGFWQDTPIFDQVNAGIHQFNVRDKNGCGAILTDEVAAAVYLSFFTPNGDDINDFWTIEGLPASFEPSITIYNRYGMLMAQIVPESLGWNGTSNGIRMPSSDYWFKVAYIEDGTMKTYQSHFALKR